MRAAEARDHGRLQRVFGLLPTRATPSVVASGALALASLAAGPIMMIPAVAALVGVGAMAAADRKAIEDRLREVETWGFPVEGYRAWLLANEPAFDVELQREVTLELIEASVLAVDAAIVVERKAEGVVRLVTRRIDLPSSRHHRAMKVGDRRLLLELRDRILAPLHADAGIVAMRMGDRATLQTIVSARSKTPVADPRDELGGAFRDQAKVAPPALQALERVGTTHLRPASDARASRRRRDRIMHATGRTPPGPGTLFALTVAGGTAGASFGGAIAVMGLVGAFVTSLYATTQRNRTHLKSVFAATTKHGFVVEGYDDWLLSGRPIFDLELGRPIERTWLEDRLHIKAYSVAAGTEVAWVETIVWLSDTLVRIETRPTLVEPSGSSIPPFYGGSRVLFEQLIGDVLVPLHANVGIVAVRMGGHVDRRA